MLIRDVIEKYTRILSDKSPTPKLDVEVLLCHVLEFDDRIKLMLRYSDEMSDLDLNKFENLFNMRMDKKPIAYIINKKEFMGYDFYVNENVLIPRPDTEIIVEETISILNSIIDSMSDKSNSICDSDSVNDGLVCDSEYKKNGSICDSNPVNDGLVCDPNLIFVDMCTGSGAIAISTAKYCKDVSKVNFFAVDVSKPALDVSKKNASDLGVDFINFVESDLFSNDVFCNLEAKVDIIVSNPPYIEDDVIATLEDDVKDYEPILALSGGSDGMYFYNKIISESRKYLKKDGFLIFESGHDQSNKISSEMKRCGFDDIYTIKDLQGFNRAVIGKYPRR